jgi:polysaccharide pyruvyl transferase CsaB
VIPAPVSPAGEPAEPADQGSAQGPGTAARRTRVFLIGYYGVHNLGDDAILAAIEAAAPRLGVEIVHYASRDRHDPDPRAVPIVGPGLWRYARAILRADRVVLGGGGILKDESVRLPLELFVTTVAARLARRPVALLAVGVGPLHGRVGRWLVRAIARLASERVVRDDASADELRRLGVRGVVVGADPVFAAGGGADEIPGPALAAEMAVVDDAALPVDADRTAEPPLPGEQPRAVVSLRDWYLEEPDHDERMARLHRAVADAIAPLATAGWRIDLVSLYWPRDRLEAEAVAADERLAGTTVVDRELDWPELQSLIGGADLMIAMRYHALAAAATLDVPSIALAYESKVAALARTLRIPAVDVADDADLATLPGLVAEATRTGSAAADPDARSIARPDPDAVRQLRERAEAGLRLALVGRPRD